MLTTEEQIEKIQKEIRETPYHKATEHYIGKLRAKIARLKDNELAKSSKKGGGGGGYAVKKQGDATVVLVGPPSAGKSTLINRLTNAKSKIAPYAFTTVTVIPGMMDYRDAKIQILDVPGLIEGAEEGKGRGREVLSVVRASDLLIIITDPKRIDAIKRIKAALERNGIRINKVKPDVDIEKKHKGGILVHSNVKQPFSKETVKEVSSEFGIKNGEITIKEHLTFDKLIDAFSLNRVYIPAITVINKEDTLKNKPTTDENLYISAEESTNLDILKETIWERLGFVRVFLVRKDEEPGKENPIIMLHGSNLKEVAEKIGTEFGEKVKEAKIWGSGAKFPAQDVSLNTIVQDGMQIRFL